MSSKQLSERVGGFTITVDSRGYQIVDAAAFARVHLQFDPAGCDPFTNLQRARLWLVDYLRAQKEGFTAPEYAQAALRGHRGPNSISAGCLYRGPDGNLYEIPPEGIAPAPRYGSDKPHTNAAKAAGDPS